MDSSIHRLDARTKIIVTHPLPLVIDLCDRAVLMRAGRKIEDLPTKELLRNEFHKFGQVFCKLDLNELPQRNPPSPPF